MDISEIIDAINAKRIRITDHADEEAQADNLKYEEIYFTALHGESLKTTQKTSLIPVVLFLEKYPQVIRFPQFGRIMKRVNGRY